MGHSMFSRLMTVFLAVILVCTVVLISFFYYSTRESLVNARITELTAQAREVAFLASQSGDTRIQLGFYKETSSDRYLQWKTQQIYERYNTYCIVVNRAGESHLYYNPSNLSDEELWATFNKQDILTTLDRVRSGEAVIALNNAANGPMFTIAIPYMKDGTVLGAALIQTAAQTIHAAYNNLLVPALIASGVALLVAWVLCFLFTRRVTRPLTEMEGAATAMAHGDFTVKAAEIGSSETQSLAHSFNLMAEQLNELETSRKEFIANVSHELRSPITSIQGYMQSMLDGTIPPEDQSKYMQVVQDETRRLSKLINGLLNLSRIEREDMALALTDFDINETARRVLITKMNQIDEKNIEVNADFSFDPCFVNADQDQIEQVLINLVDNALKFTPKDGHLDLSSRVEGDTVFFRVSDDGCGILPEDQNHVFDRFYKADKAHTVGKGTGLGLSISKGIMEKHGQTIRLVPSVRGAVFEFTLKKSISNGGIHAGQSESET